jgi:hypothetical protein
LRILKCSSSLIASFFTSSGSASTVFLWFRSLRFAASFSHDAA